MSSKSNNSTRSRRVNELEKSTQIVEEYNKLKKSIKEQKQILVQLKEIMKYENVDDVFSEFVIFSSIFLIIFYDYFINTIFLVVLTP